jgi:hypothetical protein
MTTYPGLDVFVVGFADVAVAESVKPRFLG